MTKKYKIFTEERIPFIKSLIILAQKSGKKTIMSPFDNMEDIPITTCRKFIDEIENNNDPD